MSNLHEVVELGAMSDHRMTHCRTVDSGVGSNLIVALENDIANLRDLLIFTVHRCETEAIGTYHAARVQDTVVANHAIVIHLYTSIDDAVLAHLDVLTEIDLRVYL